MSELCPNCQLPLNGHPQCLSCNRGFGDVATEILGPVTWDEVVSHLKAKLFMDEEWVVDGEQELTWYPWMLPVKIYVRAEGSFEDGPDNWMLVTSEIEIVEIDEARGLEWAADLNFDFSLGAFVYEDGRLRVQTTLALNPLCRGLLHLFHDQVLAQATVAYKLAARFEDEGLKVLVEEHPISGFHRTPDELLGVYYDDCVLPIVDGYAEQVEVARTEILRDLMIREGFTLGFQSEEVTYFESLASYAGVGVMQDHPKFRKYGPGIMINGMVANKRYAFDPIFANQANIIVGRELPCSQFGPIGIVEDLDDAQRASSMFVQLTYGSLAVCCEDPLAMAIQIKNATTHVMATMRLFAEFMDLLSTQD